MSLFNSLARDVNILDSLALALHCNQTLAWAIEYAPNGDVDALIAAAWRDSPTEMPMLNLAFWRPAGYHRNDQFAQSVLRAAGSLPLNSLAAAEAVRAVVPAPTFAELIREIPT